MLGRIVSRGKPQWRISSSGFWGDPFLDLGGDSANLKTVLIFRNLHPVVTATFLKRVIRLYTGTHKSIRSIIRVDDDSNPYMSKAMAILTSENDAAQVASHLDGTVIIGIPIRVHLRRISERNDMTTHQPRPRPAPLYRTSLNNPSIASTQNINVVLNPSALDSSIEPPTSIFHKFPQLPTEIRIMIWKLYLESQHSRYVQLEWRGWKNGFKSRSPVPGCLQINQESRWEAEKQNVLTLSSRTVGPSVRFNYSTDGLYLTKSLQEKSMGHLTLSRLLIKVRPEDLSGIQVIFFDYGLWFTPRRADRPTARKFRTQLPSLLRVNIVASNGLTLNGNGSAHIDDLPLDFKNSLDYRFTHDPNWAFTLLFSHIKHEFTNEALAFPEWVPPKIRPVHVTRGGQHLELQVNTRGFEI